MVTIPHFQNCGVGENLDPIFNAAISGPQNFNLLTQGAGVLRAGALAAAKTGHTDASRSRCARSRG